MTFRTHRADANTKGIVEGLRKAGRSVLMIASPHPGVPDLLVGYRGRMWLADIKSVSKTGKVSAGAARSRARQAVWAETWRGVPVQEWSGLDEALAATE